MTFLAFSYHSVVLWCIFLHTDNPKWVKFLHICTASCTQIIKCYSSLIAFMSADCLATFSLRETRGEVISLGVWFSLKLCLPTSWLFFWKWQSLGSIRFSIWTYTITWLRNVCLSFNCSMMFPYNSNTCHVWFGAYSTTKTDFLEILYQFKSWKHISKHILVFTFNLQDSVRFKNGLTPKAWNTGLATCGGYLATSYYL